MDAPETADTCINCGQLIISTRQVQHPWCQLCDECADKTTEETEAMKPIAVIPSANCLAMCQFAARIGMGFDTSPRGRVVMVPIGRGATNAHIERMPRYHGQMGAAYR